MIEQTMFMQLLNSVSLVFIAIVCLITYGINETFKGILKKPLPRNVKSIISLIVGILVAIFYIYKLETSIESVLLSFLICTFGYDLILKPILKAIKAKFSTKYTDG